MEIEKGCRRLHHCQLCLQSKIGMTFATPILPRIFIYSLHEPSPKSLVLFQPFFYDFIDEYHLVSLCKDLQKMPNIKCFLSIVMQQLFEKNYARFLISSSKSWAEVLNCLCREFRNSPHVFPSDKMECLSQTGTRSVEQRPAPKGPAEKPDNFFAPSCYHPLFSQYKNHAPYHHIEQDISP